MTDTAIAPYQFTIDAAIAEWLAQKETRTGSRKTRQAYEDTMRQFRQFLSKGGLDLLSNPVDIARVAALWANMRTDTSRRSGEDVSPSTYNQRLAILSSWYTFVQEVYKLEIPNPIESVWVTHIVTLGGYLHRSHREQLALPREAYSPSAWWSTMYVNRRGHDVSNPYSQETTSASLCVSTTY